MKFPKIRRRFGSARPRRQAAALGAIGLLLVAVLANRLSQPSGSRDPAPALRALGTAAPEGQPPKPDSPDRIPVGHQVDGGVLEKARVAGINALRETEGGLQLKHPLHHVEFSRDGVAFAPRTGGPQWNWRLASVAWGDGIPTMIDDAAEPRQDAEPFSRTVSYQRTPWLRELYVPRLRTLEQQFILTGRPLAPGGDLVIEGTVEADENAVFDSSSPRGWVWRSAEGAVSLGQVTVYDANGERLPAEMAATAQSTRITVAAAGLAGAAYPVTIDPEIGANDFQISDVGGNWWEYFEARRPDVAYNATDNEYLVVWSGDDITDGETEIYGQRLDATGGEIGENDFRISDMGLDRRLGYTATAPTVAHDSSRNRYFVVWNGRDDQEAAYDRLSELYGQQLNPDGSHLNINDVRLTAMNRGGTGSARSPDLLYDPATDRFVFVWVGVSTERLGSNDQEVWIDYINARDGFPLDGVHTRVSDMGPDGNGSFFAIWPAITRNSTNGHYLVVWEGYDDTGNLVAGESEIFGQLLNASLSEIGTNDFRISDMGDDAELSPDERQRFFAAAPGVGHDPAKNVFLVAWAGNDDQGGVQPNHTHIFGQLVSAAGMPTGTNDFRINRSPSPSDIDDRLGTFAPKVIFEPGAEEFVVIWRGYHLAPGSISLVKEVWAQRVAFDGTVLETDDFRLSQLGKPGDESFGAVWPSLAYSSGTKDFLCVWQGTAAEVVRRETETFGQRFTSGTTGFKEVGGDDVRISDLGPDVDTVFDAFEPSVAHNPLEDEFLVAFSAMDELAPPRLGYRHTQIFVRRLDAGTGQLLAPDEYPISSMENRAHFPEVTHNPFENEYLVVWSGDDRTRFGDEEFEEIYGQRLAADGSETGEDDFQISDMGADDTNPNFDARSPDLAFNAAQNQYLVVWQGNESTFTTPFSPGEILPDWEIYGQLLNRSGSEIGTNDFAISEMGSSPDWQNAAQEPSVVYNPDANEYLVVWEGEVERLSTRIFGQRINAGSGNAVGTDDFPISSIPGDQPDVTYNPTAREYLVVWSGLDLRLAEFELEIFGQRLEASTGNEVGEDDFRISHMGPDGSNRHFAFDPQVTYNAGEDEYLVVWDGVHDADGQVDNEFEVFGQRLRGVAAESLAGPMVRLSDAGGLGVQRFLAFEPAVAIDPSRNRYLVTWDANDPDSGSPDGQFQVYGQFFTGVQPARILEIRIVGADVIITYQAITDDYYRLQRSGDLRAGSWAPMGPVVRGTGGIDQLIDIGGYSSARGYYRVERVLPP